MASRTASKVGSAVLLILAGVFLFFAQSAYWVNNTIFDQENFTEITTNTLLMESSRNAIATTVVNRALEDRPVLQRTIGKRAVSFTSGLLGSDISRQAIEAVTDKTYAYITAPNRQDIAIDLSPVKGVLTQLVNVARNPNNAERLEDANAQIPDEIVLVESDTFPSASKAVQTMLWIGPLLWLATIISFVLYVYLGRREYAKRIYLAGLVILLVGILGMFTSPFVPPPIAAAVGNIDIRPVAQNLAHAFLQPFKQQMMYMIGVTLAVLLVFNQRFNIYNLIRKIFERPSKNKAEKAPALKTTKAVAPVKTTKNAAKPQKAAPKNNSKNSKKAKKRK